MDYSYLKGRSDHSLTCYNSRQDSNDQTRVECARWNRAEERVGVSTWIPADVCSLTDVLLVSQTWRKPIVSLKRYFTASKRHGNAKHNHES